MVLSIPAVDPTPTDSVGLKNTFSFSDDSKKGDSIGISNVLG